MSVERVARKGKRKSPKVGKRSKTAKKTGRKEVGVSRQKTFPDLPTEKKDHHVALLDCTLLVYGREKIGKTGYLASFPDVLFLTTEPGTKGQKIYEYNSDDGACRSWDFVQAAVRLLEQTNDFKMVVMDTVDRGYDMCLDWVCEHRGIEYPGTDEFGREDYGKSWKAVKREFLGIVHRILQTGRGLAFTSHSKEAEIKTKSGERYFRIFPSMSNQARVTVEALVDLFFYVDYMRAPDGSTQRVIITEGNEVVWAGARELGTTLPRFIPMTRKGGYDILEAAFRGEDVGLDPKTLLPAKTASEAVRKFFQLARREKPKAQPDQRPKKRTGKEVSRKKIAKRRRKIS